MRLPRRVEIRDSRLWLLDHVPSDVAAVAERCAKAARLSPAEEQPAVEAACLAAALRMRSLGRRVEPPGPFPSTRGPGDLDGEVTYLVRVARVYARSPIVRQARDSILSEPVRTPREEPQEQALA